jgi:mono/diheme cytochrome c family protein
MELRRMRSFISFQPGEQRSCVGCHESRAVAPTDTPAAQAARRAPSVPVPPAWGTRAVSFLRDVQPIFDRNCTSCHAGLKPAGGLDFSGGLVPGAALKLTGGGELRLDGHNRAYQTLMTNQLVAYSCKGDPPSVITPPLAFGSHKSKLIDVLSAEAHAKRVKLTEEDRLRLVTWIDANAPYHDNFINMRVKPAPYDLPADQELRGKLAAIQVKRCAACHTAEEVTRLDWIDLRQPRASRMLAAPLDKAAGGNGTCRQPTYKDTNDPDYHAALALIEAAVKRAWEAPRRDLIAIKDSAGH